MLEFKGCFSAEAGNPLSYVVAQLLNPSALLEGKVNRMHKALFTLPALHYRPRDLIVKFSSLSAEKINYEKSQRVSRAYTKRPQAAGLFQDRSYLVTIYSIIKVSLPAKKKVCPFFFNY